MSGPRSRKHEPSVPEAGQLLRRRVLGSDAVYRVVGENDRGVEVEVIDVPGLDPGSRFTLAKKDAVSMEVLDAAEARSLQAARGAVPRQRFA